MDGFKPYAVAVLIQVIYTGYFVTCKASFDKGFSPFVFVFYRQAAASVLLVPISFIFEWKRSPPLTFAIALKLFLHALLGKRSPPLTFAIALKLFLHALLGITWGLNLNNIGLKYTSASVVSAATNSVPVFTFFLALLLRMETMKLKSRSGIGKAVGIALCVAGVVLLSFYRGPTVAPLNLHGRFSPKASSQEHAMSSTSMATWIKGSFFVLSSNLAWSLWLVLQGKILKEYPSKLLFTTFQSVFSTTQCLVVAMAFEREMSKWKLHLDIGLVTILYSGFVITGVSFYLQSWCIEKKGPVFAAIFTPLSLIFTMICSSVFIGETIYLGSVIAALLMVGGLYGFLWGKSKEDEEAHCEVSAQEAAKANVHEMETA